MIKQLLQRWQSESTGIGRLFHAYVAPVLAVISAIGGAYDLIIGLPADMVPSWVKKVVIACMILSYIGGKLTVKKDGQADNSPK